MFSGYPLDFSQATSISANKPGIDFSHPASVYLAAAHNNPALALAAISNVATIVPGTAFPSTSEALFTSSNNVNTMFVSSSGVADISTSNNYMSNAKKSNRPTNETIPSPPTISVDKFTLSSFGNIPLDEAKSEHNSALKAALQFPSSSTIKSTLPKMYRS